MSARYTITTMPYSLDAGVAAIAGATREHFAVVDTRPECEAFETITGCELYEEKPPAWRQVAYCAKRGHAELVASALNKVTNG